jgi:hypothetical protein
MFPLIVAHPFWAAVAAYWVFSAAVSAMPPPNGGKGYQWAYAFLHTIAGNLDKTFASKIPGVK